MSNDKWVLVEWGDKTLGIVSYRYLVNDGAKKLVTGSEVVVRRRTEDQLATFLTSSNDRILLEHIMKKTASIDQGAAGPSSAKDPDLSDRDPSEFSGSVSSWAPSEEEGETSESEDDRMRSTKSIQELTLEVDQIIRRRSSKKVLTPSNKVNAIIPTSMRKSNKKVENNKRRTSKGSKRKRVEVDDDDDEENDEAPVVIVQAEPNEPQVVTMEMKIDDILEMKKMFKELFKILRDMRRHNSTETESYKQEVVEITDNEPNVPEHEETRNEPIDETYKSGSDELNRSEDNILITNKYETLEDDDTEIQQSQENQETQENQEKEKDKEDVYNIQNEVNNDEWVPIGSGMTLIHRDKFRKIKWTSYTVATRGLLLAVFSRRTLATHSLTGKKSPAFQNKPAKLGLDPKKVSDIIIEIVDKFKVRENMIRSIITTKCADECKMFRTRMERKTDSSPNAEETPPLKPEPDNVEITEEED